MKMMFICSFLLIVQLAAFAQTPIVWGPERRLYFEPTAVFSPVVFAQGDTVHVFWARGGYSIYIRSTDAGVTWASPRNVYTDSLHDNGSPYQITVAGKYIYLVWTTCDTCDVFHDWVTFRRSTRCKLTGERSLLLSLMRRSLCGDKEAATIKVNTLPHLRW